MYTRAERIEPNISACAAESFSCHEKRRFRKWTIIGDSTLFS